MHDVETKPYGEQHAEIFLKYRALLSSGLRVQTVCHYVGISGRISKVNFENTKRSADDKKHEK